jgi:hypothetical protein
VARVFTGIRQKIGEKQSIGVALGAGLILVAAIALAVQHMPEKRADLNQAFYTTDDGETWFADSAYRIAPFEHEGKTAVIAQVYSYAGGSKRFCAYLAKYSPAGKERLEAAIAKARANNEPPGTAAPFRDREFMQSAMLVKARGAGKEWVPIGDPRAGEIMTIHSPDGSEVDQVLVY